MDDWLVMADGGLCGRAGAFVVLIVPWREVWDRHCAGEEKGGGFGALYQHARVIVGLVVAHA